MEVELVREDDDDFDVEAEHFLEEDDDFDAEVESKYSSSE